MGRGGGWSAQVGTGTQHCLGWFMSAHHCITVESCLLGGQGKKVSRNAEQWEAAGLGWDGKMEDQRPKGCTEIWVIRPGGGGGHTGQQASRPKGRSGETSGKP